MGQGDDYIVVTGIIDEALTQSEPVTLERRVPDMDYVTQCNNRIWGVLLPAMKFMRVSWGIRRTGIAIWDCPATVMRLPLGRRVCLQVLVLIWVMFYFLKII